MLIFDKNLPFGEVMGHPNARDCQNGVYFTSQFHYIGEDYQGDPRPWVCLQTTRTKLRESGIFVQPAPPFSLLVCSLVAAASAPDSPPSQVRDERALPVAGQAARCGCLLRPKPCAL